MFVILLHKIRMFLIYEVRKAIVDKLRSLEGKEVVC